MDRPHSAKAKRKHHQTGSGVEPAGKTNAYMKKRDGGRDGGREDWRR